MAEIVSTVSAVVSLVHITAEVSGKFQRLIHNWRDAPDIIYALSNEVTDLQVVLATLEDECEKIRSQPQQPGSTLIKLLAKYVAEGKRRLQSVAAIADKLSGYRDVKKRMKWVRKHSKVEEAKDQVKQIREKIMETLAAHGLVNSTRIKLSLDSIESSLSMHHNAARDTNEAVIQRFEAMGETLSSLGEAAMETKGKMSAMQERGQQDSVKLSAVEQELSRIKDASSGTSQTLSLLRDDSLRASKRMSSIEAQLHQSKHGMISINDLLLDNIDISSSAKEAAAEHYQTLLQVVTMNQTILMSKLETIQTQDGPTRNSTATEPESNEIDSTATLRREGLIQRRYISTSFSVAVSRAAGACTRDCCMCSCHRQSKVRKSWSLPDWLKPVVGSLSLGYTGAPADSPCDSSSCRSQGYRQYTYRYVFPTWLVQKSMWGFMACSAIGNPSFGLVVRRRTPLSPHALLRHVQDGDPSTVEAILSCHPASLNDITDAGGHTALFMCLASRHVLAHLKLLLQAGADADEENDYGRTARDAATMRYYSGWMRIEEAEEVYALLHLSEYVEEAEFTWLHKAVVGILHISIESRDVREHIRAVDKFGRTALHWAAARGDYTALQTLINAGALVDARDHQGDMPLHLAASSPSDSGSDACVDALLEAGASPFIPDKYGKLPIYDACMNGNIDVVRRMLAAGVGIDQLDTVPLDCAVVYDHVHVVQFLLQNGAAVTQPDQNGHGSFALAIQFNSHKCLKVLLRLGLSHVSRTLLHFAAAFGDAETMNILAHARLAGLDVLARNHWGYTAMQYFLSRFPPPSDALWDCFERLLNSINDANLRRLGDPTGVGFDVEEGEGDARDGDDDWTDTSESLSGDEYSPYEAGSVCDDEYYSCDDSDA